MTVEYQKVWTTMNDLEMVTSKICSAREIIDNAVDKIQGNEYDKAELLMNAAYEFLEYYLQEFDDKFKLAWQATVGDLRDGDREAYDTVMKEREYYEGKAPLSCDKDDPSPECKGAWDSFWEENYYPEEHQQYTDEELNAMCDKAEQDQKKTLNYQEAVDAGWTMTADGFWMPPQSKKKWILPVEECKDVDTDKTEYFVSFPQDLLQAANLKEGDTIEWVDNKDGSYTIHKV